MIMKFSYLHKYHLIRTNSGNVFGFTKDNKFFNKIDVTAPYLTKTNKINHLKKRSTINCLRKYYFVVPEYKYGFNRHCSKRIPRFFSRLIFYLSVICYSKNPNILDHFKSENRNVSLNINFTPIDRKEKGKHEKIFLITPFYKKLCSGLSPQSFFYFQDFPGSKLLNVF